MPGIPQDTLTELKRINTNLKDVEAVVRQIQTQGDLASILAAIAETNRLLNLLVTGQTDQSAADLGLSGGTIVPK